MSRVSIEMDGARPAFPGVIPALTVVSDVGVPGGGSGSAGSQGDGQGAPDAGNSRLIVVVDDDRSIVEGLALLLEGWGYEVLTALSLDELARNLPTATGRPGLVLADHFLPAGGTGAQAVEMVRKHAGAPVPALILTGDTTPERQAEAVALGCRLLHKPVQIGPLKDTVDSLMTGGT